MRLVEYTDGITCSDESVMKIIELTPYEKRRLRQARQNIYDVPVTGFLVRFKPSLRGNSGIVFDHFPGPNSNKRFPDGVQIFTSDVQRGQKEGLFKVIQTRNSRYVIVTVDRNESHYPFNEFWDIVSRHAGQAKGE